MEENQKKNVGRALTTDEIRLRASKWTLAGDAGLLAHLEQFSQNLQSKSQETQNNIDALYDAFEDASTAINNVTNQFLALQNSQFVENRVYDDESPNEEQKIDEKASKEEQEISLLAQYKRAVELGVKILDTHFEEVLLPPNSDSDEEEVSIENSGLVWKSKNLYARKRFPLLIGSAEWWADDNVGLGYEENINPETLSSESESDMNEENTAEKRIRISSSSSTESERISSKKAKEQIGAEYNDIFAPVGKDLLNIKSDLFSKDNISNLIKSQNMCGIGENINPLNLPENDGEEGNSYLPKRDKNSIFDDNKDGNSEEEFSSESRVRVTEQNKISNAFTRELESKLSSMGNKNVNEQTQKNKQHIKLEKEEKSALFDDNDDNDDLFSSRNSASNALLRKKSIFSERDEDDQLFGNSENLFSDSKKGATPKKSVKISTPPVEQNSSASKENNSSNLFDKPGKFSNDDLFGGNDDFLFSGKSGLGSSHNSGAPHSEWKTSRDVKFSTPTEQGDHQEVPSGDIFGGVSEIRSNGSYNVESVSAVSNEIDNSFNFSRFSSVDNSKDYGFVEPSNFSSNKSTKVESPGLFDPLLTSTRHIASDTSDYKTNRTTSSQIMQTKSESSVLHSQDNSNSKVGHSENTNSSRHQSDPHKNKGLFDEDDDDDDLFQTNKIPNPVKENNLFDDKNDLFRSGLPKVEKHQPVSEEKEENAVVHQKPSLPPVEDDEEEKFSLVDKLKQDTVSMSSSRSSLFDDANVGKTNLASVFDNDKTSKSSNDLFGETDDNLFEEKKTKNFGEHNVEDLFGDNAVPETKSKITSSLFDDLEDADDLFRDNVSKKVFEYHNDDDTDLFRNQIKDNNAKNSSTEKLFGGFERKSDSVIGSKASPDNKTEPSTTTEKLRDNIFGESDKLVKNLIISNADKSSVKDKPKPKSSTVSLFGELEDEDEDLFSSVKNKKDKKSTGKIFEEPERGSKKKEILNDDENDDAIFKVGNSKDKFTEPAEVEGRRGTSQGSLNKGPTSYNGKTEKSLSSDEKAEEKIDISANSTSNIPNNDKNDLFCGKENFSDDTTSNLIISENKFLTTEKKAIEVNDNAFSNQTVDDDGRQFDKTGNGIRPSPPNSLRLNLACNQDNNHSETDGLTISSEKEKVIGKLNIPAGLKINPMCLLPGATIKKNITEENLKKEIREEEKSENLGSTESKPSETAPNLLKCISKDRIKIQARRRPQTRRARHEALRSSGIDFEVNTQEIASVTSRSRSVDDFEKGTLTTSATKSSSDTNVNEPVLVNSVNETGQVMENADSSSSVFHSVENSPEGLFSSPMLSNPLSPSTDGEDYFNVPELDMNFEKEDQSIFQSNLNDLKNADNTDDNLLFDCAPVLSPMSPDVNLIKKGQKLESVTITRDNVISEKITDRKIAIDDEDEDNLFKVNEAKNLDTVGEKKDENKFRASDIFDDLDEGDSFLFQKKPISILGAKEVNRKKLFDDNDEDDDLFNEKSDTRNTAKRTDESVSKIQVNKSNVEKSKEPFVDPLGLITKPE